MPAQDLAYRGFDLEVSHLASDPAQNTASGHGSAVLRVSDRFGLQGDVGFEYLASEDNDQAAALIAVHPFLNLGYGVSLGGYFKGRAATERATMAGLELAWMSPFGLSAEVYYGQTWGDELDEDGHATSKGATLGYSFANDMYASLLFHKDTTSEPGQPDRDYYDYGIKAEVPVGAAGSTRLTAEIGEIRFDAEGGPETQISLGLMKTFGGVQDRPTFTRQRSVLTGLVGY